MNKRIKNWKLFTESVDLETHPLNVLIKMIDANKDSGWKGEKLQSSFDCVITSDVEHTHDESYSLEYNGWVEKMQELSSQYPELNDILKLVEDNNEDLWEHGLDDTFSCVILEDIAVDEGNNEYLHKYNGWYEQLVEFVESKIKYPTNI